MARKPNLPTIPAEDNFDPAKLEAAGEAAETFNVVQQASEEAFSTGAHLGRLETASFFATVADSIALKSFESLKKTKAWQTVKSATGRNFSSLDEFCRERLGRSYRRLQELTSNQKMLGEEAFEQAERLGLRQVDYNLIKTLSAPKQEIIKDALSEGATKEALQQAIRELAAADQQEIVALTEERDQALKDLAETTADLKAKDKLLNKKSEEVIQMQVQMEKKIAANTDWPAAVEPVSEQVAAAWRKIEKAMSELESCRIRIFEVAGEMPEAERVQYEAALSHVMNVYEHTLNTVQALLEKERATFDKTLGLYLPEDDA